MKDEKRVTDWLDIKQEKWLEKLKDRIETSSNYEKLCEILNRTVTIGSGNKKMQLALFYKNGHFSKTDGAHCEWVKD